MTKSTISWNHDHQYNQWMHQNWSYLNADSCELNQAQGDLWNKKLKNKKMSIAICRDKCSQIGHCRPPQPTSGHCDNLVSYLCMKPFWYTEGSRKYTFKYHHGVVTWAFRHWLATDGSGYIQTSSMSADIVLSQYWDLTTTGSHIRWNTWLHDRSRILGVVLFTDCLSEP